ncbi:hypothetical protein GJAV_G00090450 [Gymnothorax javanicus]|nr:hypothetical protein GJAV_G00090450 [Gymnothorax javanicus]
MAPLLFVIIIVILLPGLHGDVSSLKEVTVLEGRSVTIPCHYEPQHSRHVKYWCQGYAQFSCSVLARTDATSPPADARLSITDDPAQQVFTVVMRDVQVADSGWYWCGVELGNMWRTDDFVSVYITVSHGLSVVNSMVAGEEGGSVIVECLYSSRLSGSSKKWCRSGDWGSCAEVSSNGMLENGSVQLSDDGVGAFTVTVHSLEQADAGWYWCAAGQQQVAAHITVTPRSSTQRISRTNRPFMTSLPADPTESTSIVLSDSQGRNSLSDVMQSPSMICGALLLLVIVAVVPWKLRSQCERRRERREMGGTEWTLVPNPGCENDQTKGDVVFFSSSSPQQVYLP